ncbi:MAG: hypothetical protein COW67_03305 [Flavobacteriales bacterium CG18_big_fil_WC_8_21_14_2_50_32_9]|nr:MAG: hypothetical protein COW67_03305 [Flavobacteriales bacterium CG18_big_fil_WC_8_21_14_2_50_32_9]
MDSYYKNLILNKLLKISVLLFLALVNPSFAQKKDYNEEFQLQNDNDILTFKRKVADRYYSFGVHLDYRKIIREESKLYLFTAKHKNNLKKVIVNWHAGIEGYTSDQTRDKQENGVFVAFDRPYAGWLFAENTITAASSQSIWYVKTTLGVLGPASGAEKLQDNFHVLINNPKLENWDNQIQNEVALNLEFGVNFAIIKWSHFDIHSQSSASLGTQATFFKQGLMGRLGKFNTIDNTVFYHTNLTYEDTPPQSEYFLEFGAHLVTWGYKATIQGRMFGENTNMNTDGLHRVNVDVSAALNYSRKKFTVFFRHHLITAETSRGRHFYYGSLGIIFKI